MMLPLLALAGLFGLMLSRRSTPKPPGSTPAGKQPPSVAQEAQRIIQETKDIIDGKRDAYSDPGAADAELERARKAVLLAQQKERLTPKPTSSSSAKPKPTPAAKPRPAPARVDVGPIQVKPPATPAAPAGTDLALAKSTAPKMAAHLKQAGRDKYDRKAMRLWQTRAGLAPDGIYGRGTAAALKHFTPAAPPAFFAQGVSTYTPPAGV